MNKYSYPDEATSIPAFHLVRVQRKNNQKRRYAHVVPFLGKLAPVDHIQLNAIAVAAADAIHPLPEPTLVIGLAEASLVLAWQLVEHLHTGEVELCFTTREENRHPDARSFQEPHSHGSIHWMRRPQRSTYRSVVIVEDEITTGNTITNLVLTLRNYAKEFVILTLADLRQSNVQGWMENVCASQGLSLMVKPLLSSNVALDVRQMHQPRAVPVPQPNPHARHRRALAQAVRRLTALWQRHGPCTLYMVGECVDVPMAFCSSLPLEQRPPIHHITRSPWDVDDCHIHSQHAFGDGLSLPYYYLYNWEPNMSRHAVVVTDKPTHTIAVEVCQFLEQHAIETTMIEVDL